MVAELNDAVTALLGDRVAAELSDRVAKLEGLGGITQRLSIGGTPGPSSPAGQTVPPTLSTSQKVQATQACLPRVEQRPSTSFEHHGQRGEVRLLDQTQE